MRWSDRILIVALACAGIFAITSWPQRGQLNQAKDQLSNVEYQTKTLTYMKPNIKVQKKLDVVKAEDQVSKDLTDGFTQAFNDVNSPDDWNHKQADLSKKIGRDALLSIRNERFFADHNEWDKTDNLKLHVAFEPVKSSQNVAVMVTATYNLSIKGDDGQIRTSSHRDLWTYSYNLQDRQINSVTHQHLFDSTDDAANS